jgi:hypothetical protein
VGEFAEDNILLQNTALLPRDPLISGATEYHKMGMSIYRIYSFIPVSLLWDIFVFGYIKIPTNCGQGVSPSNSVQTA